MAEHFETPAGLDAYTTDRENIGWRNRSASLLDLDYLIGTIMDGLHTAGTECMRCVCAMGGTGLIYANDASLDVAVDGRAYAGVCFIFVHAVHSVAHVSTFFVLQEYRIIPTLFSPVTTVRTC